MQSGGALGNLHSHGSQVGTCQESMRVKAVKFQANLIFPDYVKIQSDACVSLQVLQ